ncbi:MAG TPA: endospore germination permease [bacterium]|nr:endospore germination permease [bacterium]
MEPNHNSVTPLQAVAIIVNTIISARLLILPRELATEAGNGSWVVLIVGGLIMLAVAALYTVVGRQFPGSTLPQYAVTTLGVFFGGLVSLLFAISWLLMATLSSRVFAAVIITAILPRVPLEVGIIVMLLLAAHLATKDVGTVARVHELFFPLVVGALFLLIIPSLVRINGWQLLPLMEFDGWRKLGRGTLVGLTSFLGFEIVSLFIPYYEQPEKAGRSHTLGLLIVAAIFLLVMMGCLGILGKANLVHTQWPTLTLVRMISFHGIFERLEAPFLAVYVVVIFTTMGSMLFGVVDIISDLFKIKSRTTWPYLLALPAYYLAIKPPNIVAVEQIGIMFTRIRFGLVLAAPLLILFIAYWRGKRGDPDEKPPKQP